DGVDEIIGGNQQTLFALNGGDGSTIWDFNFGTKIGMYHYAVTADLDDDGRPEILIPNWDGWMHCVSSEGKLVWRHQMDRFQISMAGIGDVDNDGELEVVYGTALHHLVALDRNGHLEWDTVVPPLNMWRTRPVIADTDKNGIPEVYSMCANRSNESGLAAVRGTDGRLLWEGAMTTKAYVCLAVADIDQDGIQEILAGDKGTTVACFTPDGTMRWRQYLGGRGIHTRPAVADIDGDGRYEIIQTVRGASPEGYSWYVLDSDGNVLARYSQDGGCFGSPAVLDIDQDGVLEVIVNSRSRPFVTAYCFGGPATENAVLVSGWEGPGGPFRSPTPQRKSSPQPPSTKMIRDLPPGRFGFNPFQVELKKSEDKRALEVATLTPEGETHLCVYRVHTAESRLEAAWPVTVSGQYKINLRFLNLEEGEVLGIQSFAQNIKDPVEGLWKVADDTIEFLSQTSEKISPKSPEAVVSLRYQENQIKGEFEILKARIEEALRFGAAERDKVFVETDQFVKRLGSARDYANLLESEVNEGRRPAFVLWQDQNPWDNTDPLVELPVSGGPLNLSVWALGNETESVAVNALNLSNRALTLRVEPGKVSNLGIDEKPRSAHKYVDFHRVVWLPDQFGRDVGDLLPKIAEGYLLDIAPGEVKQIWLNINTQNLGPGKYEFTWDVRTLDAASVTTQLKLNLEVSPVTLPEESRYIANFWSQNEIGDINTIPDLNRAGQTVWYGLPLPAGQVNEKGELLGEIDWSAHDAILQQAKQVRMILYNGGPRTPRFLDGVDVTDELRLTAQRSWSKALVNHLRTFGLDYQNFCFYVEDEPGLTGGVESYIEKAKEVKRIDPNFQNYANPYGTVTIEMIRDMEPYTDYWQPGLETFTLMGKPFVEAMRGPKGNKPIGTFTPPGDVRIVKPLGYYRAMAWQAFYWGFEGGGYWRYAQDDMWQTAPEKQPGFGAVVCDGRELVTTRRWEATRDGIEDFNMLDLLREKLKEKPNERIQSILDEAVDYMAEKTIVRAYREAVDYDPEFSRLQEYRVRLGRSLEELCAN
ncbi:MAG: FG-GAP-like repeat-containing protein, partial [bacterium]